MTVPDRFHKALVETANMLNDHKRVKRFSVVGSALYKEDAQDLDLLVLTDHACFQGYSSETGVVRDLTDVARWTFGADWNLCGGAYDQTDQWGALRKDEVNLIVTTDPAWYDRAVLANTVCVALKLQNKGDRVVVYRVVRDGYTADEANARRDGSR